MNGVALVRAIKIHRPDIVAIMLSGFAHLGTILGAINEAEVFRYVTKPWNDDELRSLVAAAIARKSCAAGAGRKTQADQPDPDSAMAQLEAKYPGITKGVWDAGDLRARRW